MNMYSSSSLLFFGCFTGSKALHFNITSKSPNLASSAGIELSCLYPCQIPRLLVKNSLNFTDCNSGHVKHRLKSDDEYGAHYDWKTMMTERTW
jgi:hypothetical protein